MGPPVGAACFLQVLLNFSSCNPSCRRDKGFTLCSSRPLSACVLLMALVMTPGSQPSPSLLSAPKDGRKRSYRLLPSIFCSLQKSHFSVEKVLLKQSRTLHHVLENKSKTKWKCQCGPGRGCKRSFIYWDGKWTPKSQRSVNTISHYNLARGRLWAWAAASPSALSLRVTCISAGSTRSCLLIYLFFLIKIPSLRFSQIKWPIQLVKQGCHQMSWCGGGGRWWGTDQHHLPSQNHRTFGVGRDVWYLGLGKQTALPQQHTWEKHWKLRARESKRMTQKLAQVYRIILMASECDCLVAFFSLIVSFSLFFSLSWCLRGLWTQRSSWLWGP